MENQHLLSKSERHLIESKYKIEPLYRALRDVVYEWEKRTNNFSLSAEELFYHTLYSIDLLRDADDKNARIETCRSLWNEIYYHIKNHTINADEKDMRNASSIVVCSVDYSLMVIDIDMFLDDIMILKKSCQTNNEGSIHNIENLFESWFIPIKRRSLKEWLVAYWESKDWISDDINELVANIGDKNGSLKEENFKTIAQELSPLFYNNKVETANYLNKIKDLQPRQIHEVTNDYYEKRIISCKGTKSKLGNILISHNILHETLSNWNINVKYPQNA